MNSYKSKKNEFHHACFYICASLNACFFYYSNWDKECAKSFNNEDKNNNKRPNLFNTFLKTFGRRYFSYVGLFAIDGWIIRYIYTHCFFCKIVCKSQNVFCLFMKHIQSVSTFVPQVFHTVFWQWHGYNWMAVFLCSRRLFINIVPHFVESSYRISNVCIRNEMPCRSFIVNLSKGKEGLEYNI